MAIVLYDYTGKFFGGWDNEVCSTLNDPVITLRVQYGLQIQYPQ